MDTHIEDCIRFRVALTNAAKETRDEIKSLTKTVTDNTKDINIMNVKLAVALGVLMLASRAVEWILQWKLGH